MKSPYISKSAVEFSRPVHNVNNLSKFVSDKEVKSKETKKYTIVETGVNKLYVKFPADVSRKMRFTGYYKATSKSGDKQNKVTFTLYVYSPGINPWNPINTQTKTAICKCEGNCDFVAGTGIGSCSDDEKFLIEYNLDTDKQYKIEIELVTWDRVIKSTREASLTYEQIN